MARLGLIGAALSPGISAATEELTASIKVAVVKHAVTGHGAAAGLSIAA